MPRFPSTTRRSTATAAAGALAALAFLVAGTAVAPAGEATVRIEAAWARATPPGAKTGAAYLTLVNEGDAPDRLVAAAAPVAARVELHAMEMTGGVMRMRPLPDGIALPPGETVTLGPGGTHLMLMGLESPLAEGGRFPLELTFERAGRQTVEVRIGGIGASAPPQ